MFGGDGASFAVAPGDLDLAREALAATAAWVREDLELSMRVALVPVSAVRVGSAPCDLESAYRNSGSCGSTCRLTVAIPNGANGTR